MKLSLLSALLIVLLVAPAAAQAPGPGPAGRGGQGPMPGGRGGRLGGMPPRDNAAMPTGTARITGRVVVADTGTPIRRAQISLNSRDAGFNRNVTTDSEGRYELTGLPAGRYRLYVSKAGFVALEYGQARPFEAGKPLDIVAGQALEKIDFSLPRGSAITGRITDEFGDPITDVQVEAMRYQFVNGERQLVNAGRIAQTDDLGAYRIFGLMPGDYVVRASMRPNMPPGPRNADTESTGYPGTYYPGVTDVTQAQTVTAMLGQEVASIGFSLVPARLSRISGTVMGSNGQPLAGAMVMIRTRGSNALAALRMNMIGNAGGQVRQDGTFQLTNVPPGDYTLDVQQRPRAMQNLQDLDALQLEFASMPISVSGDIDNLTIVTSPGVTVVGRVVYQGQAPPKQNLQITAVPPAGGPSPIGALISAKALGGGRVNQNGAFELRGIAGPQLIRVQALPAGWALKSITIDGADITDAPYDFKPGVNVSGLVVTLTDRLSEITGNVRDARGQAVMDYVLVAFPEDAKLWGPQSRYVQTTRPNQNGTFSIKGLPPGRYLAAVVPALENGLQNDPAVLDQLRPHAHSFSLAEGQMLNLNLEMPAQ
ncbi:MAG TPA: carboxypeptidase-like regulatory domain-containing protein [Vicinamibacterales bacterium]|nr:carboxypeptidase-like regulatory domain-containing protein [Vicinamibacterales bacterium]